MPRNKTPPVQQRKPTLAQTDSRAAGKRRTGRKPARQGPDETKRDILDIATEEFAEHGLTGARVDAIALRTRTSKRMIYYYFGGKEGLYAAVLDRAYASIRSIESDLHLEKIEPIEALRRLIDSTFDYDEAHPEFIRLVSIENINNARHMRRLRSIRVNNRSVLRVLSDILERGRANGVFPREIEPIDLHMVISALCFFRVSNKHTFGSIFGIDFAKPKTRARHKALLSDILLAFLRTADPLES
jgi:AcrR family transcriptional regulator